MLSISERCPSFFVLLDHVTRIFEQAQFYMLREVNYKLSQNYSTQTFTIYYLVPMYLYDCTILLYRKENGGLITNN